jgi:predicted Zn-dependent protease
MLREQPDDAWLWVYRGHAALQAGEREVALSSLETAIRLGDDQASNLQVCATLHMELGSISRAVDLLKSGFAGGMDFAFIDQAMSWLEHEEEWALLEKLVHSVREGWDSLDPLQRSKVLMREADISIHQGDESAARNALEKAIALDPSNAYALMSLAGIHRLTRDYNRAESLYQRASAYDLYRENALVSLAQLALDQEDVERALQILRDTLKEFPHRTDLNRNIESLEKLVLVTDR